MADDTTAPIDDTALTAYAVDLKYYDGLGTTRTTILALDTDPENVRERAENTDDVAVVFNVREANTLADWP